MNSLKSIDIDNLEDFILCELLAQKIDITLPVLKVRCWCKKNTKYLENLFS